MTSKPRKPPTASMTVMGDAADGAPAPTSPGLVVLYSPHAPYLPGAFPFHKPSLVIGRDRGCDITLPEVAVSAEHASVSLVKGRWMLADLGSRNQTHVGGDPIPAPVALDEQQVIRIGDTVLRYVATGAEGYARHCINGAVVGETPEKSAERYRSPIVGGYQMQRLGERLDRVAGSRLSVLLHGETGTGKDVLARHLHALSRREGPFHAVNCGALSAGLIEGELFGYRKGAFTGSTADHPGFFRASHEGTLFLDEIGDMPLDLQVKLLRVIESGEVTPVGSVRAEKVDVRLVFATHRDLAKRVEAGLFRADLRARLEQLVIEIPPLRSRKEDIYWLARHLLLRQGHGALFPGVAFMSALLHYDFPGNVRELDNALGCVLIDGGGRGLDDSHLPDALRAQRPSFGGRRERASGASRPGKPAPRVRASGVREVWTTPSKAAVLAALAQHRGNLHLVGKAFGRGRGSAHRWLRLHGIDPAPYRRAK